MIISSEYIPLVLAFALGNTAVAKESTLRGSLLGKGGSSGKLKKLDAGGCTILEKADLCLPNYPCHHHETREFACEEVSTGQIYRIEDDLIDISKGNKLGLLNINEDADILESARTFFVGDADIDAARGAIKFNRGRFGKARPENNKGGGRALQAVGSPKVLALNIISSEGTTTGYDNSHLADSVFGSLVGGSKDITLSSQYAACSHGKLNFGPLEDKMSGDASVVSDVSDGVVTVYSAVSTESGQGAIRSDATSKLTAAHGNKGGADYVMACLPVGKMGNPYAYINHWLSVYPANSCTNAGIQLHELGHNMNLGHSGEGGGTDDKSGAMGYGGGQKTCFNGAKIWQLGWFSDRHVTLIPGADSFSGRLYGTTQYDVTTSSDKMILRLHDSGCSTCDFYISFNHAASYNSGTREGKDMVQIHTKEGTPGQSKISKAVARLGGGDSYTASVYNGVNVTIAVSSVNYDEGWAEIVATPSSTAAPTTAPTTLAPTTEPPTPAPETGSFYTTCGSSAGRCSGKSSEPADVNENHELRCCADSQLPGFSKHESCSLEVWSESQFDGMCYHDVSWNDGRAVCASHGARLCTEDEILADCARGSGCSHDHDMIWSATRVATTSAPTSQPSDKPTVAPSNGPTTHPSGSPSKPPSLSPTTDPTANPTPSPSFGPSKQPTSGPTFPPTPAPSVTSTDFLHKVVCGSTSGECHNSPVLLANVAEAHAVRCCSDTAKSGWVKQTQCAVWGESNLPACYGAKTYTEAEGICAANDARVCTEDEIISDCVHGSGCGLNDHHVWSSSTVPKCADDVSCDDGLACTIDTCNVQTGKCINEAICGKMVACGSTADNCVLPYVKGADPGELHEVRCCSDTARPGWVKKDLCTSTLGRDVWGESNGSLGACNPAKTYEEAEVICLAGDARLCSVEEVRADCTRGSGCNFDREHVWTSTDVPASGVEATEKPPTNMNSGSDVAWAWTTESPPGPTTESPKNGLLGIAEEIVVACDQYKISSGDIAECQELCLGHLCCFAAGGESCIGEECLAYAGCAPLFEDYE